MTLFWRIPGNTCSQINVVLAIWKIWFGSCHFENFFYKVPIWELRLESCDLKKSDRKTKIWDLTFHLVNAFRKLGFGKCICLKELYVGSCFSDICLCNTPFRKYICWVIIWKARLRNSVLKWCALKKMNTMNTLSRWTGE